MTEERKEKLSEWFMKNWKMGMAFVYTLVVVCDFIIFPAWVGITRTGFLELVQAMDGLDAEVQKHLLEISRKEYNPFTLKGGGLFHVSFGAILTTSAFNKNDPKLQPFTTPTK